jgi:hypothetical protein
MKAAQAHVEALRGEGKHAEAHSFMTTFLEAFTNADEAAEFKAFSRVVKHFNRIDESNKADQLINTFCALDSAGLNRLGELLLGCGNDDKQYEYLVNWGEASADQQKGMLRITRLEIPLDEQAGHVFASELRRVGESLRESSNTHIEQIIERLRAKRARRAAGLL